MSMAGPENSTDMGIGVTIAFSVLAVIGALVMVLGAPAKTAGVGFTAAMVFAGLAIVAAHRYGVTPNS
ncbi:MAG: hypothetical protein ACI9PP_000434 [Halobacteriales archaeon]|jgi:hypothetical protein